jgi:hypothetical protein
MYRDAPHGAFAVLTLHHWTDWRRGLDEMRRVADRLVVFTVEPGEIGNFWLTETYFPEIVNLDQARCPSVAEIMRHVGDCRVDHVAVPCDCADGFLAAFWRRPEACLGNGVSVTSDRSRPSMCATGSGDNMNGARTAPRFERRSICAPPGR